MSQQPSESIHGFDLTKQTITLGKDEPCLSLMRGHVDAKTWVKATHAEGWGSGAPLTKKALKSEAKSEKDEIIHTYGIENENGGWVWNLDEDEPNAEPVTIRHW